MREKLPTNFRLKRPCKNCPFAPTKSRIVFATRERAEEISESAYRNGFPCHLSADNIEFDGGEESGFVFSERTQHCAGALMMWVRETEASGWPGIDNDEDLATAIEANLDWSALHYESEEDFLKKAVQKRNGKRP